MKRTQRSVLCAIALSITAPHALNAQPGELDPLYNGTGYVVQPVNTADAVQKILVQADQKILAIGMSWDATYTAHAHVFRYLPDGTPDTDFATNGVFTYTLDNEALLYSGMITSTGKILLVGATTDYQTYRMLLIQLNEDGTPDETFGTGGVVTESVSLVEPNAEDMLYDVTQDDQGNILVCGSSYDLNYVRRPVVVRFKPDGELDTAFGTNGVATIPVMTVGASAFKAIEMQPDGKIVASGYFGQTELWYLLLLVRFNADGSPDSTFSADGIIKHNYGNVDDQAEELQITADGSIITAGKTVTVTYNYSALLMKFTPAGEVDASFGDAGAVVEDLDDFDYGWNVALQPDGKIIMAGTSGDGPPNGFDLAVWKYLPDGTPDNAFGNNGLAHHVIPDYYAMIYGMALQGDGKILIGGQARTTNNQNYFFTARLQNETISSIADGSVPAEALVAPNPATAGSWVTVSTTQTIQADARIHVFAADGRCVVTYRPQRSDRGAGRLGIQLPVGIAPGAYQLVLEQQGTRLTSTVLVTN
jgi:uncharacterized delta-60 repeat protein